MLTRHTSVVGRLLGFLFLLIAVCPASANPVTLGTLYGTDGSGGNLLRINPTTGAGTLVGNMGIGAVPALAVDPTTGIMYAGRGAGLPNIYTINPASGAATFVGSTGLGFSAVSGMDFRADGTLFASVNILGDGGTGAESLATINEVTGLATVIGSFDGIEGMEAIAFAPNGVLYGATTVRGAAGPDSSLFTINTTTGAATLVAHIVNAAGAQPSGGVSSLQFLSDGTLLGGTARAIGGATDGGRLITINPTTGAFTFMGTVSATDGPSLAALAGVSATAIPEPSSLSLFGIGLVGLSCYLWRHKRQ